MEEFELDNESLQKIQGGMMAKTGGQLILEGDMWCSSDEGSNDQITGYSDCCLLDFYGNCL